MSRLRSNKTAMKLDANIMSMSIRKPASPLMILRRQRFLATKQRLKRPPLAKIHKKKNGIQTLWIGMAPMTQPTPRTGMQRSRTRGLHHR